MVSAHVGESDAFVYVYLSASAVLLYFPADSGCSTEWSAFVYGWGGVNPNIGNGQARMCIRLRFLSGLSDLSAFIYRMGSHWIYIPISPDT